jgi:hypothetical protein
MTGETSYPPWQVALTVAVGVACALRPLRRRTDNAALTVVSLIAGMSLLALALAANRLFLLFVSACFVAYGSRGLVTGRITLKGRVGPEREYTGLSAYLQSILCILFGAGGIALAYFIEAI